VRARRKRKSKLRRVSLQKLIPRREAETAILKRHHRRKLRLLERKLRRGQGLRGLIKVGLQPNLENLLKKRK
jgi:hypothetical protein